MEYTNQQMTILKTIVQAILVMFLVFAAVIVANAQRSLYQDFKAHNAGDIITVLLVENVAGSSTLNASSQSNVNGTATGTLTGNFLPFAPTFGGNSGIDMNSGERVNSNQSQLLRGTVSVRIVRIEAENQYFVEGFRDLEINGDKYTVQVSGYVRGFDIDDMNQVLSTRIANAEINYVAKNRISSATRRSGFWKRTFWVLSTGALVGAAIISS